MLRTGLLVVVCGGVALGLGACSGGSSTKSSGGSTTVPAASRTVALPTTTVGGGATTTLPSGPTSTAPDRTTTPAVATTAAGGRVVTKPSDNVRLGDSGSGVKQIQTALVAHGYKIAVDGKFGVKTQQAVKDFQSKNGLKADGVVGPATWAKLQATGTATTTKPTATTVKGTATTKKP